MRVTHLSLVDFRNYRSAELSLEAGPNLIFGRNGQGKTNLVEAIGYFSALRSHRVSSDSALIRAGSERAIARLKAAVGQRDVLLEVEVPREGRSRARVNRNDVRPRELTRWFASVAFAPEDLAIVRGEPSLRRRFLDEGLTLRHPMAAGTLSDYDRVLRQRTALLKSARNSGAKKIDDTLAIWDDQLVELGSQIMLARRELVEVLRDPLRRGYETLVGEDHRPILELSESACPDVSRETGSGPPAVEWSGNRSDASVVERSEHSSRSRNHSENTVISTALNHLTNPVVVRSEHSERSRNHQDHPAVEQRRHALSERSELKHRHDDDDQVVERSQNHRVEVNHSVPNTPDPNVSRETLMHQFHETLADVRSKELERGVTLVGPHRDDLRMSLNGLPVKGYASHGESWSFALSLKLALALALRGESAGGDPVIILDDVFAELDSGRRERLMSAVLDFEQVIVTAAVVDDVPDSIPWHRVEIDSGAIVGVES